MQHFVGNDNVFLVGFTAGFTAVEGRFGQLVAHVLLLLLLSHEHLLLRRLRLIRQFGSQVLLGRQDLLRVLSHFVIYGLDKRVVSLFRTLNPSDGFLTLIALLLRVATIRLSDHLLYILLH